MREIKFRALIQYSNLEPQWIYYGTKTIPYAFNPNPNEKVKILAEDLQYTGLKDKNGKEIYEGDILLKLSFNPSNPEHFTEVKFMQGAFLCETPKGLREDVAFPNHHEVVGNIYENPNLLDSPA